MGSHLQGQQQTNRISQYVCTPTHLHICSTVCSLPVYTSAYTIQLFLDLCCSRSICSNP